MNKIRPAISRFLSPLAILLASTFFLSGIPGYTAAPNTAIAVKRPAASQDSPQNIAPDENSPSTHPPKDVHEGEYHTSDKSAIKPAVSYTQVSPLDIVREPEKYLEKGVAFEGVFNTFSPIGLDYKKAFRSSTDYITMLINRPDVSNHTIPLSELKLFFPRKESEAVLHLESGDKIDVKGKEFSTALGDAWVDVTDLKILTPKKATEKTGEKSSVKKSGKESH